MQLAHNEESVLGNANVPVLYLFGNIAIAVLLRHTHKGADHGGLLSRGFHAIHMHPAHLQLQLSTHAVVQTLVHELVPLSLLWVV